jgi:hypothetical protein
MVTGNCKSKSNFFSLRSKLETIVVKFQRGQNVCDIDKIISLENFLILEIDNEFVAFCFYYHFLFPSLQI